METTPSAFSKSTESTPSLDFVFIPRPLDAGDGPEKTDIRPAAPSFTVVHRRADEAHQSSSSRAPSFRTDPCIMRPWPDKRIWRRSWWLPERIPGGRTATRRPPCRWGTGRTGGPKQVAVSPRRTRGEKMEFLPWKAAISGRNRATDCLRLLIFALYHYTKVS